MPRSSKTTPPSKGSSASTKAKSGSKDAGAAGGGGEGNGHWWDLGGYTFSFQEALTILMVVRSAAAAISWVLLADPAAVERPACLRCLRAAKCYPPPDQFCNPDHVLRHTQAAVQATAIHETFTFLTVTSNPGTLLIATRPSTTGSLCITWSTALGSRHGSAFHLACLYSCSVSFSFWTPPPVSVSPF